MYNKRTAEAITMQLAAICKGRADLTANTETVGKELIKALEIGNIITPKDLCRLNKVLFATRSFDLGLKTFLLAANVAIEPNARHIRGYLGYLKSYQGDLFHQLNGDVAKRIEETVVHDRNRFMHVAGQYPTPNEVDTILGNVADYLSLIIGLRN